MKRALAACIALAAAGGCSGEILDPSAGPAAGGRADKGDGGAAGDGSDGSAEAPECNPEAARADTTPARILTQRQYNNAIRDLLGEGLPELEQSTAGGGAFDNAVASKASSVVMPALQSTAEEVAAAAFAEGFDPGCGTDLEGRACATHFVRTFGRRVFRRPVNDSTVTLLTGLYDELRSEEGGGAGHRKALEGVLAAMLQMPRFLYRIEGGVDRAEGRIPLDGYEMASRLSFFLWNTIPDEALLDAAEAGELNTEAGVRRWARSMLEDPRARRSIAHLYEQILDLDRVPYLVKDPEIYSAFDQEIGEAMRKATLAFIETVIFDRNGTVADLYDADFRMLNERLARFYGIEGVTGDELQPVEVDPERRSGLLTHGSFLAQNGKQSRTHPIARGVHVIRNVLCWTLPDPPPDIPSLEDDVGAGSSVREQLEAHRQPGCATCHQMIDPIGLAFESYNTIGRYRTEDVAGNPVDSSSELKTPSGETVSIEGPVDLSEFVAESSDTGRCTTKKLFANAFARMPEGSADRCMLRQLRGEDGANDVPIREMLVDIAASDLFRHRMNPRSEVCE